MQKLLLLLFITVPAIAADLSKGYTMVHAPTKKFPLRSWSMVPTSPTDEKSKQALTTPAQPNPKPQAPQLPTSSALQQPLQVSGATLIVESALRPLRRSEGMTFNVNKP